MKRKNIAKSMVNVDGLGPKDKRRIKTALRRVWAWSNPRRLCLKRSEGPDGFPICESCHQTVVKTYPDHITPVGEVDGGIIERMFCPSYMLQALCKSCHAKKTRADNKLLKSLKK